MSTFKRYHKIGWDEVYSVGRLRSQYRMGRCQLEVGSKVWPRAQYELLSNVAVSKWSRKVIFQSLYCKFDFKEAMEHKTLVCNAVLAQR